MEGGGSHFVGFPATWVRVLDEGENGGVALLLRNSLFAFCRLAGGLFCVSQFCHLQGAHWTGRRRWDEWPEVLEEFFHVELDGLPISAIEVFDRLCIGARRLGDCCS